MSHPHAGDDYWTEIAFHTDGEPDNFRVALASAGRDNRTVVLLKAGGELFELKPSEAHALGYLLQRAAEVWITPEPVPELKEITGSGNITVRGIATPRG